MFTKNHKRGKVATTLVEMMITVAIYSIVIGGLATIYISSIKVASGTRGQLNVQSLARKGIDTMMEDLRRGNTAQIFDAYSLSPTLSTNGQGKYFRVLCPTNSVVSASQIYRHFYISNITILANGLTNSMLYYYTSGSTNEAPSSVEGEPEMIIDGVTNPEMIFQQVGGAFVFNIRLVDPNDQDGKQVIFLRSAVAFRNPGLF